MIQLIDTSKNLFEQAKTETSQYIKYPNDNAFFHSRELHLYTQETHVSASNNKFTKLKDKNPEVSAFTTVITPKTLPKVQDSVLWMQISFTDTLQLQIFRVARNYKLQTSLIQNI